MLWRKAEAREGWKRDWEDIWIGWSAKTYPKKFHLRRHLNKMRKEFRKIPGKNKSKWPEVEVSLKQSEQWGEGRRCVGRVGKYKFICILPLLWIKGKGGGFQQRNNMTWVLFYNDHAGYCTRLGILHKSHSVRLRVKNWKQRDSKGMNSGPCET